MARVVGAIEALYSNFPPTLSTTQVNSVKKKLKTEVSGLVKHPAGYDFIERLSRLLLDLGTHYFYLILH